MGAAGSLFWLAPGDAEDAFADWEKNRATEIDAI